MRIEGIDDANASWMTRLLYRAAKARTGAVPQPLRITAHSAAVKWATSLYEVSFARARALAPALRDLASLKVASMVGCVF